MKIHEYQAKAILKKLAFSELRVNIILMKKKSGSLEGNGRMNYFPIVLILIVIL